MGTFVYEKLAHVFYTDYFIYPFKLSYLTFYQEQLFPSTIDNSYMTRILLFGAFAATANALSLFPFMGKQQQQQQPLGNLGFVSPQRDAPEHESCPVDSPISCTIGTSDSCCLEATNGLFLATQFWDFYPQTGPSDLFTTHGLWSDKCNGGFLQFCNKAWEITNVTQALESLGMDELLKQMKYSWKNMGHDDEELWLHEFNKHGTCMSTVNPSCYAADADKYQYVGDFFKSVVDLQDTLPTFKFLADAGISPSLEKKYKLSDIEAALSKHVRGSTVRLGCKGDALLEVWYYFKLRGSVASGAFVPADADSKSSCPAEVYFVPKGKPNPGHGGGGGGGKGNRGYLKPGGQKGCIISTGNWFTSGTCAQFRLAEAEFGGVSLSTSRGPCDVVDGSLVCKRGNKLAQFTQDGDTIMYNGEPLWSADHVPEHQEQIKIRPGGLGPITFNLTFEAL